jgi:hypothetical protein
MYAKVIKDGFTYTNEVGQAQSANAGSKIMVMVKGDWDRGLKEGYLVEFNPHDKKKPSTITSESGFQEEIIEPAKAADGPIYPKQGAIIVGKYINDDEEVTEGTGEVLVVDKKQNIRVKFQGDDAKFRILDIKDIVKIVGSGE